MPHPFDHRPTGTAPPDEEVRPPDYYGLPPGYRQRDLAVTRDGTVPEEGAAAREYWNAERLESSARYQYHVYTWAARLARGRRAGCRVLDVGCGPATKLATLVAPTGASVTGVDQPSAVAAALRLGRPGRYVSADLERCAGLPVEDPFDLIICADVIEHLLDPDPVLRFMRRCSHAGTVVLLSTPDRARLRGRACLASEKPEHVREWTAPEFRAFLASRGWDVLRARCLPADDAPLCDGIWADCLWRLRLRATSPRRCYTVLCRPRPERPAATPSEEGTHADTGHL